MKSLLLFILLLPCLAHAQRYALKTPDNAGLYLDPTTKQPVFVTPGKDFPVGKESQYWLVNDDVPAGAVRIGVELKAGKVEPVLRTEAAKPAFDPVVEKLNAVLLLDGKGEQITYVKVPLTEAEAKRAALTKELQAFIATNGAAIAAGEADEKTVAQGLALMLREYAANRSALP